MTVCSWSIFMLPVISDCFPIGVKQQVCQRLRLGLKLDLKTGYLMTRLRYTRRGTRKKEGSGCEEHPRTEVPSSLLSANCNHDKDKEITHWVYFQMKQRKSQIKEIRHTGLHLDKVVLRCNVCRWASGVLLNVSL